MPTPKNKGVRIVWILGGLIALGWAAVAWVCGLPTFLQSEIDSESTEVRSPDGKYLAKLLYRENRAMTYGYYHVTIEETDPRSGPVELVEVAAEGLSDVTWRDKRILVVSYDPGRDTDKEPNTCFVKKPSSWKDVTIEYRPIEQ